MHTPMVVGPSGRHIGLALEVEPREILLSYAEGLMWLLSDVIFTRDDDYITLICEENGIRRYCR